MADDFNTGGINEPLGRARSVRKRWLAGCGIALAGFLLICLVSSFFGYRYLRAQYEKIVAEFVDQGFTKVEGEAGQAMQVTAPLEAPTLFVAQEVNFATDSTADVAIIAQTAYVSGEIAGTLYFRGQTLTVNKDAVIGGNLNVNARSVNILGVLKGQVVGTYVELNDQRPQAEAAPPMESTAPAEPQSEIESTAAAEQPVEIESTAQPVSTQ